jgi:sugar/nucleoside kinase (ribokinase family)
MMRRFAGNDVFVVDTKRYNGARLGKRKYLKYETYVGNDEIGNAIREYGRKYPKKPIILQDDKTGSMIFLRYGRSGMFTESFSVGNRGDVDT